MLLEDCPTKILDSFNVDSLEEVHLKLSTKQDQLQDKHEISLDNFARKKKPSNHKSFKLRNIQALMIKNFIQLNGMLVEQLIQFISNQLYISLQISLYVLGCTSICSSFSVVS